MTSTAEGGSEIDADDAFLQIVTAIDDLFEKTGRIRDEIMAVAQCAFWHSLLGIDAKGKPTTKVFGWADTRSREHVATLRKRFDETEAHNRTGARFHSSFWPAKLLWYQKEHPAIFARTDKWLSLSDYVLAKLTGELGTSVSMASATGIFDIRKCVWDASLIKFLKVKANNLPPLAGNSEIFRLNTKFARRWPRLADAKWLPSIGDGAANNIGAGCVKRSRSALMIGTSGAMRIAYKGEPPERIPPGLWCYRVDRERVIVGGALSDGGGMYRWMRDNLRVDDSVDMKIAGRLPDGHGLTFLPFLAGERSTGYHEFATGAVLGLRPNTDAVDITQAAMESVAHRFAEIFDQLKTVTRINEIVASGGALRESQVWTQIIADVLGRNISLIDAREASMRGAVLLGLETIGKIKNIERIRPNLGRMFTYERTRNTSYRKARARHRTLYRLFLNTE